MSRAWSVSLVVVLLLISPLLVGGAGTAAAFSSALHAPVKGSPAVLPGPGSFAFVATFEDHSLDGWTVTTGHARVVGTPNYNGEPSLRSVAQGASQIDLAGQSSGVAAGDLFVSFQAAVRPGSGTGYVGLADSSGGAVAVVGVGSGHVWAGSNPTTAKSIEPIPQGTAQPAGWVYLSANVYETTLKNKATAWVMDVFVDRSDQVAATQVSVPNAGDYAAFLLQTTSGTVHYTDTILTNYQIPVQIPGYNNMEGYGQGSGLIVQFLPDFEVLSAQMTLNSWQIPQAGILSFQINAMNYQGTTRSTCVGFFQLGIDLDPNGMIAPWYVPGKNCIAHYFVHSQNPAVLPGVPTPMPTHLDLSIAEDVASGTITFTIVDTSIGMTFTDSIPYAGSAFDGSYTQLEFQPCCNQSPIQSYQFTGSLYDMAITTPGSVTEPLNATYMLPFTLDAPPSWNLNYYASSTAGYSQVA